MLGKERKYLWNRKYGDKMDKRRMWERKMGSRKMRGREKITENWGVKGRKDKE